MGAEFLVANGFNVVAHRSMSVREAGRMSAVDTQRIEDWISAEILHNADGIVVSCTNFARVGGTVSVEKRIGPSSRPTR